MTVFWALVSAGAVALVSPAAVSMSSRLGMIAIPNRRSSHSTPKPRGYGVVVCVVSLTLWTYLDLLGGLGRSSPSITLLVACVSIVGLLDDWMGLTAKVRLLIQFIAAATLVVVAVIALQDRTHSFATQLLAGLGILFVVGNTNATNFMDGIDGLALVNAVLVGAVGAWLLLVHGNERLASASAVVAGGALGALPMNFPSSRAFIGDVGSYFLGFTYGSLLVIVGVVDIRIAVLWLAMFVPFITDTSLTVVERWRRKESILSSHRDHAYQRASIVLRSHVIVTGVFAALLCLCAATVVLAVKLRLSALLPAALSTCASALVYSLVPRSVRKVR